MRPRLDRLQRVVNILRKVKPSEFDMSFWDCGTAACAAGHYRRKYPHHFEPAMDEKCVYRIKLATGETDVNAMIVHFGLPAFDARELFLPWDGNKKATDKWSVIKRFERFIARHRVTK